MQATIIIEMKHLLFLSTCDSILLIVEQTIGCQFLHSIASISKLTYIKKIINCGY